MFLNPLSNAFGLDIGDLSVKVVQLRNRSYTSRHPKFSVEAYRSVDLPPGMIVNGELLRPEDIRGHIQTLLFGEKGQPAVRGHWVVASIPEQQSAIKVVQTDTEPARLSAEDIAALAAQHIPFEQGSYYLDWQTIPCEGDGRPAPCLLLGAVPKNIADSYTYLLESLGLGVVALEIESIATARAMITAQKEYQNESRIILDIGATGTCVIVYDYDSIRFSTSLPFSGELLTMALSQKKNIPHDEAEEEKKRAGVSFSPGDAWPALAQLVADLENGIRKAIDFYYSHFPDAHKITRMTLAGGGAAMKELGPVLENALGIPAAPGNPWKNLSTKHPPGDPGTALRYATAIGLALAAADNPLLTHDSV